MRCDDDEVRTANERTPIKMQREEGRRGRNNKYPKKRKTDRKILPHILWVCMCLWGKNPRHNGTKCSFNILKNLQRAKKNPKLEMIKKLSTWKSISNVEYLIFETRLCVEITKFQSELTKLQRTERCETQNIQRQFSFPSTNLFVTVAERQQNTATTTKKKKMRRNRNKTTLSLFFWVSPPLLLSPYGQGR